MENISTQEAIEEVKSWTDVLLGMGEKCTEKTAKAQCMAIDTLEKTKLIEDLLRCHDDYCFETSQKNYKLVKAIRVILGMEDRPN